MFGDIANREVEFISLSRDTTESDIKQRRELRGGESYFVDQAAVRAALHGRLLILEGLEKAERNILPILNNLLENREMQLEDGRFLTPAHRLTDAKSSSKLVAVHPNFRVIALTQPCPPYQGNPLDPPLRSRFQARYVPPMSSWDTIALAKVMYPKLTADAITTVTSFVKALNLADEQSLQTDSAKRLVDFPDNGIFHYCNMMELFPYMSPGDVMAHIYPPILTSFDESKRTMVKAALKQFNLDTGKSGYTLHSVEGSSHSKKVHFKNTNGTQLQLETWGGSQPSYVPEGYIMTSSQEDMVARMVMDHIANRDMSILGDVGSGKSSIVQRFAGLLGYDAIEIMALYKDMSTRDLFQKRITSASGDTIWEDSALVRGAMEGKVVVLDNVNQLPLGTLSVLSRLIQERELDLPDGTRLVSRDRYDAMPSKEGCQAMHPSFRMVALGTLPSATHKYITPEVLGLFSHHIMPEMPMSDQLQIIRGLVPNAPSEMASLLHLGQRLRQEKMVGLRYSFSQILRNGIRMSHFPNDARHPRPLVENSLLSTFLPETHRERLQSVMDECGIAKGHPPGDPVSFEQHRRDASGDEELVPAVEFYDIAQHRLVLSDMLKDYIVGEHLLLMGNQGVGKNKLTDTFLHRLNLPREYIQLHRDTTVSSLISQGSVHHGRIVWGNSPLVTAVEMGRVLVIDEADKCPLEVTALLKNLIQGNITLPDGRKMMHPTLIRGAADKVLAIHPHFRMIVLANRPGFPFLGNDFFSECGHLFACHVIDNPDPASEVHLLQKYAPDLSVAFLKKLSAAFADLRSLVERGLLAYPYSTRECVNVVKHLRHFPEESVGAALANVFSFDSHDAQVVEEVNKIFHKHGLPTQAVFAPTQVQLQPPPSPSQKLTLKKGGHGQLGSPKHGKEDPNNEPHVGGNTWAGGSGGRDTAGLGGRGGPYRLDSGNPIFQVPEHLKREVPEEVLRAAREIAEAELNAKLREIDLTQQEALKFESYYLGIKTQAQQLRVILQGLEAKEKERVWMKNQTSGDLDDSKLIEGLTGEKNIYRKRGQDASGFGNQQKKKMIRFVLDVSGSMYRFNSYDHRLERMLQIALLIMESLQGFEHKFSYSIYGHSGDSAKIPFVRQDEPPKSIKDKYLILKKMVAHTMYCSSGDYTLEATSQAIDDVAEMEGDQHFVFTLSDANLERYGISPKRLGSILSKKENVEAFIIFIASFGDEAKQITEDLPPGRGIVCPNTADLPNVFKKLFSRVAI
eukprot:TRINITY_DN3062_c0_g1_i3.p1 TRINITY_DN3062_c0_g1~~TRINITY_DN3062_c0_g1_i3.p1  ORF type:complete len:1359 (+),score=391.60 TRINITY_DN3062_c0_g1_i3:331-4077(+)